MKDDKKNVLVMMIGISFLIILSGLVISGTLSLSVVCSMAGYDNCISDSYEDAAMRIGIKKVHERLDGRLTSFDVAYRCEEASEYGGDTTAWYWYQPTHTDWDGFCDKDGCIGTEIPLEGIVESGKDHADQRLYIMCHNEVYGVIGAMQSYAFNGFEFKLPPANEYVDCIKDSQCAPDERCRLGAGYYTCVLRATNPPPTDDSEPPVDEPVDNVIPLPVKPNPTDKTKLYILGGCTLFSIGLILSTLKWRK